MGCWDYAGFDNDTALDWVFDLTQKKKSLWRKRTLNLFALPASAIRVASRTKAGEWIDMNDCEEAIAAAECIAAANGKSLAILPGAVEDWLRLLNGRQPKAELVQRAIQTVIRIRNDERSDLRSTWSIEEEYPKWLSAIDDLIARLGS